MSYRRDKCKRCKRPKKKAGYISARGLCHDCNMERQAEFADMARKASREFGSKRRDRQLARERKRYREVE